MKKDKLDIIITTALLFVAVAVLATFAFVGIQEKKKMDEWRQEREQEVEEVDQFMNDLNQWKLDYESHQEELEQFKTDKGRWDGAGFID